MTLNRPFLTILGGVIAVGLLIGWWTQQGIEASQPELLARAGAATPQAVDERRWLDTPTERLLTLGGEESVDLFGPLKLRVADDGSLFVADHGELSIKKFSPGGELIRRYGAGEGQGPGELASISDFAPLADGTLWVSDLSNARILVFDADGTVRETVKLEVQPYRLVVAEGGGAFVIMSPFGRPDLFARHAPDGREVETFGAFMENQAQDGFVLDGHVQRAGDDRFVYAATYAGLLASFGFDGELRWLAQTLDPRPLPKIVGNSQGARWVDREALPSAMSLAADSEKLHVLTVLHDGIRRTGAIDTYDVANGLYLHSRRLPEPSLEAHVVDDHLYTVTETSVSKWLLPTAG